MEKIAPGKYVELGYDLYAVELDGTEKLVHQTDADDPERIVFGVTKGMILPLERAIDGLEAGGKFNVTVSAEEAFGPYDPEQVVELEREIFIVEGKFDEKVIKPGAHVPMMTADGYRINGLVREVTPEIVKMDFNHPLAGKTVRFDGSILIVREATADDLKPASGCGCGCSGDCEGGDCGSGCGGCN